MLGDAFSVETSGHLLSVGTGVAGTHGYYKGDAFGVINCMQKKNLFLNILPYGARYQHHSIQWSKRAETCFR